MVAIRTKKHEIQLSYEELIGPKYESNTLNIPLTSTGKGIYIDSYFWF